MSYGYVCDRCRKPMLSRETVEIRGRFLAQGRWTGRRWLHVCMACWNRMFDKPETEK